MNKFLFFCFFVTGVKFLEESVEWVEEYNRGEQSIESNLLVEAAVEGLRDQLL